MDQAAYANLLGVTQAYVSMLESGKRKFTPKLHEKLAQLFASQPTKLPLALSVTELDDDTLASTLSTLGYPGFAHLKHATPRNPAALLLECLRKSNLDVRVVEALPWLLSHHETLDLAWLTREAKFRNLQNRLGFLTALANEVTPKPHLAQLLESLEPARLAAQKTLCNDSMPMGERRWLLEGNQTPLAQHWNLLTDLQPAHLKALQPRKFFYATAR